MLNRHTSFRRSAAAIAEGITVRRTALRCAGVRGLSCCAGVLLLEGWLGGRLTGEVTWWCRLIAEVLDRNQAF